MKTMNNIQHQIELEINRLECEYPSLDAHYSHINVIDDILATLINHYG